MIFIPKDQYKPIFSVVITFALDLIFLIVGFNLGRYYENKQWSTDYVKNLKIEMEERFIMIPDYMWHRMVKDGGVFVTIKSKGQVEGNSIMDPPGY